MSRSVTGTILSGSLPVEARLYAAVILQARHDSLRRGQLGEQARAWLRGEDQGGLTFQECVDAIEAFKPKNDLEPFSGQVVTQCRSPHRRT